MAWVPAAAALGAAAALVAMVVPRANEAAAVIRPPAAHRTVTTPHHTIPAAARSGALPHTAKMVTPRPARRHRAPAAATPATPAVQGVSPNSPAAPSPAPSATAQVPVPAPAPTAATVPDVLYTTLSAAASTLKGRGLDNIPYLYGCYGSPDINDVIRQDPGSGARIALTAPVQLYLQANNCHTVPNVIGMSLSDAAYTLKQSGFSNIPYLYDCYGSANTGTVVSQSPIAGTSYGITQPVSLKLQANNC